SIDVSTGMILLVWSYTFGIILAGFASLVLVLLRKIGWIGERVTSKSLSDHKYLSVLEQDTIKAYKAVLKIDNSVEVNWSQAHFYLSRSLVENWMPFSSQLIRRQISLRRVRENLMPCMFIWCFAGIGWGFKWFYLGPKIWGIALASLSLILSLLIVYTLATRWAGNCSREIQEVYLALLVGFHTGMFEKQDKKTDPSKGG
ncbi:MAG: hypothetical protein ACREBD_32545, partial [Blastocatellia bacterium]